MEKTDTKKQILDVALELFSTRGYEATSISQIADAVGIRKASLYSHFESKQDILDKLVEWTNSEYEQHSIMINADWDDEGFTVGKENMSVEDVISMIKGQTLFIINDPVISRVRKMLNIEQYRNEYLRDIEHQHSYSDILSYNKGLIGFLIRTGHLRQDDVEMMAASFAWPISMWVFLCDRYPEKQDEAMDLIERHIRHFFKMYGND